MFVVTALWTPNRVFITRSSTPMGLRRRPAALSVASWKIPDSPASLFSLYRRKQCGSKIFVTCCTEREWVEASGKWVFVYRTVGMQNVSCVFWWRRPYTWKHVFHFSQFVITNIRKLIFINTFQCENEYRRKMVFWLPFLHSIGQR